MLSRARLSVQVGLTLLVAAGCRDSPSAERAAPGRVAEESQVEAVDPRLTASLPSGVTAEMVEEGREQFLVCAVCHGFDARGNQLGPSLRDDEWITASRDMEALERVIREGVPEPEEYPVPMPPMGGGDLTPEQVRALAAFVYAVSGDSLAAGS